MTAQDPSSAHNLDGYGAPEIAWTRVREVLDGEITQAPDTGGPHRHTLWLTTINPGGGPHVTPVGVVNIAGVQYFTSGPATRKSRNLARDARCVISLATQPFDLVVEGTAERVTDADELERAAAAYAHEGWPARVEGDGVTADYSAPSAGPPPWHVYKVIPATVFAFGAAEPYGATPFDLMPSR
jgi:hypothetical protein